MKRLKGMRGYLARQVNWLLAILLIMIVIRPDVTLRNNRVVITLGPSEAYAAGTADYSLDGLADDVEMQSALNALPNQGGLLHFKAGTYNLTANVTRAIGNVTIEGEGRNTLFTGSGVFVAGGNQWVFRDMALNATTQVDMGATTGWKWFNVYDSIIFWTVRDSANGQSVFATANTTQLNATTANVSTLNTQLLGNLDTWLTSHNTSQATAHNLSGLLALKANLASPIFTGIVSLPTTDIGYNDLLRVSALRSGTGNTFLDFVSQKTVAGDAIRMWTYNSANVDTTRFSLNGYINNAIATWTAVTQTWSSYGAGTLVTDANGVVTASSDSRLKNVMGTFTKGLKAILNLSPIEFKWKPQYAQNGTVLNDATNNYTGFIAQDVMQYIPEAVGQAPDGNYTLSDRALIAALVNSVKELQAEIDVLNVQLGNPAYDRTLVPITDEAKVVKSKK